MRWLLEQLEARVGIPALAVVAGIVFGVSVLGWTLGSSNTQGSSDSQKSSSSTTISSSTSSSVVATGISGFKTAALQVTTPDSTSPRKFCVAVAGSVEEQSKGMMGQDSFGGLDGMAFPFSEDTNSAFYMANVKMPLAIAFFNDKGEFISSKEMPLCTVAPKDCPTFGPGQPFRLALETKEGGLADMGIGQGSTVSLGGSCA